MAWMLSLKALLVLTSVVFVGLALKLSVPLALEFCASHVPLLWVSPLSWLKPPYLYLDINGIIIGIVASLRFHHSSDRDHQHDPMPPPEAPEEITSEFGVLEPTVAHELREEALEVTSEVTKAVVVVNGSAEDCTLFTLLTARLKNLVDKDAEEKSDAATEALLQELVVDAEETKKGVAILLLMVEMILNWRLIGLLGSTDELNQQEEELRAEFEEVERKLEETLELQRRMENDAKQKRLAEQNDNVED
ncbi:hypothetical protein CJ030_MR2G027112 [Morella rubra]|uniref:DUF4408 domain-containing protein n=1 Tax=Morella rubra TaxID=262757 RepID=A0A6A1W8Q5_9ROSI|nr:hypothetical protein CJ030_MR2G027112 [Morella rubra]